MSNDGVDVRMSDGRLFHARGPATANAGSPMVERRVDMEHFPVRRDAVTIAVNVQASPQDSSARSKLLLKLRLRMAIF